MPSDTDQLEQVRPTTYRDAALALLIGIGFDVAFNQPRLGVSVALFALGAAIVLRARVRRSWEDDLLLAGAVALASFSAILAAEWLLVLNLMMAASLVVGVVARTEVDLFRVTILDLLRRAGHVFVSGLHAPAGLLLPLGRAVGNIGSDRLRRAVRAAAIAAPILLLFTLLLASADRVFSSLIVPDLPSWNLAGWSIHAGWIVFGALLGMTAFVAASRPIAAAPDVRPLPRSLSSLEWGSVLAGVNALFALFVAVQFAFLFGGDERVRITNGLTYAEYARSGFFQLLAVSALTVLLILGLWDLGDIERHRTRFRAGVTMLVLLTGVVLASAAMRMTLYERAFGFTVLRLMVMIALVCIGIALLGILALIWRNAREHVVALFCSCAVAGLLALNLVNPERFVAEHNAERFRLRGKIDVAYLQQLGPDAVEPSLRVLRRLSGDERAVLRAHVCGFADEQYGWPSANLARSRAQGLLANIDCSETAADAR